MQGMVIWGKEYSVPLLVELLDQNSTTKQQKIILGALIDFKDYSAIEPVAKVLAEGNSNLYTASNYLATIGPNAEKAVLAYVRPTSLELTKETIRLLGKIGSRKSLVAFVRLKKLPYYNLVEQDIREAKQAVLDRLNKDQP